MRRSSIFVYSLFLLGCLSLPCSATVVTEALEIKGNFIELKIDPNDGGCIYTYQLSSMVGNLAGRDGLLQEGFGVGSYYVPNRRLNERFEILEEFERPVLKYSYDCDGPNIRGLHVTRLMELLPDAASMRVTWTIENQGEERQWIAPWVRNTVAPGGSVSDADRLDLPTIYGLLQPDYSAYYPAARNWFAATDAIEEQSIYTVFDANDTYAFLSLWSKGDPNRGVQTAFVPRLLAPGERWQTVYRLNAVRGLQHIDFATDELAVQLDYRAGKLTALVSAAVSLPDVELHAQVNAGNGRVWRLPAHKLSLKPNRIIRCTYPWVPPGDGAYTFTAQIQQKGVPYPLGKDTASPHGKVDTQFYTGKRPTDSGSVTFPAWTQAPNTLSRTGRILERTAATPGNTAVWFESPLEKIFREDQMEPSGTVNPVHRIYLARNERESFQLVLRPQKGKPLTNVQVRLNELVNASSGARISEENIHIYRVQYHNVDIPSHFEGPTGAWPDALLPYAPFTAYGDQCSPIWFTLHANADLPAGVYRGLLELWADEYEPRELFIEAHVFDFTLPKTPALKTSFGFHPATAFAGAQAAGGTASQTTLVKRYTENALAHRVTLRGLIDLPKAQAHYENTLEDYLPKLDALLKNGATTIAVPASLLETPALLALADDFVNEHKLTDKVFVQLATEPKEPAWPRLLESMQQWKNHAPHIPITVPTCGLRPFLPDGLDLWNVHLQTFDTTHGRQILQHIREGHETWWQLNHTPPRPYANFFLDFSAMEHRILFWQSWALGVKGLHYWNINFTEPHQDPWKSLLDITPVNGDGFLVYPGADGPVNSIRWECIRDGIEDYDYLALLWSEIRRIQTNHPNTPALQQALAAYDIHELVPNLVTFPRKTAPLTKKRHEIGAAIETLRALK